MVKRARNEALEKQYKDQGECCYYCKEMIPYELITRDHIKPLSKGNVLVQNKIFACKTCNNLKGSRTFKEFRALIFKRMLKVYREIDEQKMIPNEYQLNILRHHTMVLMTICEIIDNNEEIPIAFT
jgi:hypothetical protein